MAAKYTLAMYAEAVIPDRAPDDKGWVYRPTYDRKEMLRD